VRRKHWYADISNRALIFALISIACRGSRDATAKSDTVAAYRQVVAAQVSGSRDSTSTRKSIAQCEPTGRWAECSVKKRLESAGFVPLPAPVGVKRSGFSVTPRAYTLGHARLEIFLYPDERALAHDVARLDTTTVAPIGGQNSWQAPPIFIRSANLIAVFLTDNPRQAERLTLAITAGAPQRRGPQKLKPSISTPSSPR
jgi:hypothetical protein